MRNNVKVRGHGPRSMVFAHGFGCDQTMWRHVAPAFEADFQTVLFDHVGAGDADISAYDSRKYEGLTGYAGDLIEIVRTLNLTAPVFVGHSVSAMIGVLAAGEAPWLFADLVLITPSPRYIDDGDYIGGFGADEIQDLLDFLSEDPMGWSRTMGPAIMGNPGRPELGAELAASFCRVDPVIARDFARATFTSDHRAELAEVATRTLILQCRDDIIAPPSVGRYVHERMRNSMLVTLEVSGHCPHLSAPSEVIRAIKAFV